jgi:hypothetical protein
MAASDNERLKTQSERVSGAQPLVAVDCTSRLDSSISCHDGARYRRRGRGVPLKGGNRVYTRELIPMGDVPSTAPVMRFDLSAGVTDVKQLRAGWRAFGGVFLVIGVALAAVGLFVVVAHFDTDASYEESGAIVAFTGMVLTVACWPIAMQARAYPTFLTVSEREVTVGTHSGPPPRVIRWTDSNLKLGLIDRRGLPSIRPDGRPRHPFAFQAGGNGPWVPIPREAYEAIRQQAVAHSLLLTSRTESLPGTRGTFEEISIRGPR